MTESRYQLLIFDWDGTLMDSEAHIVASMQAAMAELGLEVLSRATVRNIIGLGMREAIARLFPTLADDRFIERFTAAYRGHYFAPGAAQQLFADAESTLRVLHQTGYLMAVATGKSRHGLDQSLADTGLADLFQASRCADETASKPHPLMLTEILQDLNIEPQQAIMIGDTEYDLQMANNAGMPGIGVTCGVHERERLLRHGPLACLDTVAALPEFLGVGLSLAEAQLI